MLQMHEGNSFDVIIIGGGPAGMAAAIWCDELGLTALLLESGAELGGQLLWTYNAIKNHLGVEAENGREMRDIFVSQFQKRKFSVETNCEVVDVDFERKYVYLKSGEVFTAKAIVIATGVRRRKLGIAGEDDFKGRGIIESGVRDAHLIAGKRVCIVGGGDAALENALILAETAREVVIVHRRSEFRGRNEFIELIRENKKIKILTETSITKINGFEKLESLELRNLRSNETFTLEIDSLLFRIGVEPNSNMFQKTLQMDELGYIKIESSCETSITGIFAVGDVSNPLAPTISSSIGMGTTAIKVIHQKIVGL